VNDLQQQLTSHMSALNELFNYLSTVL
jgi:hypothetical protein